MFAAAPPPIVVADRAGDSGSAPDITKVRVTTAAKGRIAFVVVNANTLTGTGPYCVAGDHTTPLVYVGGAPDAQYRASQGRLASYGPSAEGQVGVAS